MLEKLFHLKERNTTPGTEVFAGITTFLTMAYIIFVNPSILGFVGIPGLEGQGLPLAAATAMTCLGAGVISILMGLGANFPLALAPGMGLNAVVAFSLVAGLHLSWPQAMGIVFVEGVIISILVLTNVREAVMDSIPMILKKAIGVGIGIFIAVIGLINAGIVVKHPVTLITFGQFFQPDPATHQWMLNQPMLLAVIGLVITAVFMAWRLKGALLWGIILTATIGFFMGITHTPSAILSLPDFSTFLRVDPLGGIAKIGIFLWLSLVLALMLSDFFDTMGTTLAVGDKAKLLTSGKPPRLKNILFIDSLGAAFGGAINSSSVTAYIESLAGTSAGGRTGLMPVTVGILFLLAIFFAPLAGVVPKEATAPALITVGFLMMSTVREIPFDDFAEAFPAYLTIITIPLFFEISRGIGYGFIAYTLIKLFTGKGREVHPFMYAVSILFAGSFLLHY